MDSNLNYTEPDQGYDWIIVNHNDGQARVSWTGNDQVMYIGELKAQFKSIIEQLDKAAESWGVPNNLDARGRARSK